MLNTRKTGEIFRVASNVDGEPLIVKQSVSGRGHGLVASSPIKLRARETILWIRRPLAVTLETSRLQQVCYQCFHMQTGDDEELQTAEKEGPTLLKFCVGCHTVKFCGKQCQSRSWKEHHKYECKIYGALQPRVLPSPVRTIIRILKLRSNGHIDDQQWKDLLELESHQDDLSTLGGQPWQDLFLMAKATQKYSGTKEPMEIILRMCCILAVNSLTLTDVFLEPFGLVLDPVAAMLNHSCDPNCIIRFDTGLLNATLNLTSETDPILGSISVDLLSSVGDGDELTISYIDNTFPLSKRQSDLTSRYFFTCDCTRCSRGTRTPFDRLLNPSISKAISDAESNSIELLDAITSKPTTLPSMIPLICSALAHLAQTSTFPVHRYPYAPLRLQLILALIATSQWHQALLQSAILVYRIDPVIYSHPHHPIRIVNKWRLYRLARHLCVEMFDTKTMPVVSGDQEVLLKMTVVVTIMSLQFDRPKGLVPMPSSTLDKLLDGARADLMQNDSHAHGPLGKRAGSGLFDVALEAYRQSSVTAEKSLEDNWARVIDESLERERAWDDSTTD